MPLEARLSDGEAVTLDARYGDTLEDLHAVLVADSLTGSAVPLADVVLHAADGTEFRYRDIRGWVDPKGGEHGWPVAT